MKYLKCAGRVERYLTKNGIRYMAGISHSQLSVWDRIRDHVLEENSMGEERLYSCEEGTVMWLKGIENIESITS